MFSFDRLYRTCEPKKSRNQRGLDFLCFCSSCDITDPPPPHMEQFIYILTGGVCVRVVLSAVRRVVCVFAVVFSRRAESLSNFSDDNRLSAQITD